MKRYLIFLFFFPYLVSSQSFNPTPCDCAKYVVASLKLKGFDDKEDMDKSDLKILNDLERKYEKKCEKFQDYFLEKKANEKVFFKQSFVDCFLDSKQSSFCKCNYLIMPALIEMMVLGFSDDIPESIKNKREKFWKKNTKFCERYGDFDEWKNEDSEKCFSRLLKELRSN